MAAQFDPVQAAFDNAIRDFKASLGDNALIEEISKTTTIDEVYDATDALQKDQAKKGHLRHLSKIEPFLNGLREYTAVIEVFIQSKPDILSLIWGPIKLLLQWTDCLKSSFDAIINTAAELGKLLPEFKAVGLLFKENALIKEVLVLFFRDVLDFYLISLQFFSKTRWKIVFEAMWPKQREKIKIVENNIRRHASLLRNETRLQHIQDAHDTHLRMFEVFDKTEESLRQLEYNTIATNMSPTAYGDELHRLRSQFCAGTEKWLIKNTVFKEWLDTKTSVDKILWLQGIPGADERKGKTLLSTAVITESQKTGIGKVVYTFLSYKDSSSPSALSIFHSLIFQLTADDEYLQEIVCQSSKEALKSSIDIATELLKTLIHAAPVYIVIDGLDEIKELDRRQLLKQILELSEACAEVRILISSRNEVDIKQLLKDHTTIRVDLQNAGSIQKYVNQWVQKWFSERKFDSDERVEVEGLLAPLAAHARGMFLYARVVLISVRDMQTTGEIRKYLRALPQTLQDAYARILSRIHELRPLDLKEKALKIIKWVGCAPSPMTTTELGQALLVRHPDEEAVTKSLPMDFPRLCGPIVEVVDEYVQFVHFTVREYIFSPNVPGHVCRTEASLSLASCLINYLCQTHHDPDLSDEEIIGNAMAGAYCLHNLATTGWLDTLELYGRSKGSQLLSDTAIDAVERFISDRHNDAYANDATASFEPSLGCFKVASDDVYRMLCESARFRQMSQKGTFDKANGYGWTDLDPLTISRTSVKIYAQFDQILTDCATNNHQDCRCERLRRQYGHRLFKCGFTGCPFHRHGFESSSARKSHLKHHDRPWTCGVEDCEYAEGGFLSRKMRDDHLDKYHTERATREQKYSSPSDPDEVQPLLFDLVQADEVDAVRELLPVYVTLKPSIQKGLLGAAAYSASPAMIDVLSSVGLPTPYLITDSLLSKAIEGANVATFKHLLGYIETSIFLIHRDITALVVASGSEPLMEVWKPYFDVQYFTDERKSHSCASILMERSISASKGDPNKETCLISLWEKVRSEGVFTKHVLGMGLSHVAQSTCSVRLAKYLIDVGADVNYVPADDPTTPTPFRYAARRDSAAAADLIRFLLLQGADPELKPESKKVCPKIQDEKGPREIEKWLGMSWDQLLVKTREEREKGLRDGSIRA
ncbi:hypothetical protein LTR47_003516 [Exophiala xenobiotica]|nr:hypothetical protein LTR47_003516 [Exophiala xenobiotica]KAK5242626.1 hypothetical protein LTS06_011400 [Exophiala xenobiotica]KAK5259656.1 hypothetical protein LTR40_005554 [Exophiala xenobiotica]KAK5354158.1 hypothetical protein LTR61_002854 [Exophiala xenobiotica]KAK5369834.1 hypothetical protein LTR11_007166 [Exophiala xenobiotica]